MWHIPFLFLYFFALRACVETSGNPYEVALAHHKAKGYDPDALAKATAPAKPAVVDDWMTGAAATARRTIAGAISRRTRTNPRRGGGGG